ncbi:MULTISPECIES: hypothetical protein [unclassified Streptosporangium]|uniref:hypothetical protein n=1 Tax=unclassified Streptosporangium TaxID=2632669 RepID=UPI002E285329|nr:MULTISPECIES: hypothetical protein [unclassified Streptosporangium]
MNGRAPSRLGGGRAVVRPLTGRLPESGQQVEGSSLRGAELAERMRKSAERLQQVRAVAKVLIREARAGTPSP